MIALSGLADTVLSTLSDAIVAADKDGTIRFWNPGAVRMFGFASSEAVGQTLDLIIPERQRARHWPGYRQVMATGQSRYSQGDILAVPAMRKDGSRVSIEFRILPLRDSDGGIAGMAAIMRDVTSRFEEMRALRKNLPAAPGLVDHPSDSDMRRPFFTVVHSRRASRRRCPHHSAVTHQSAIQ
jgi:PAS domain S-box-containing protein